jgi:hypothetical protein
MGAVRACKRCSAKFEGRPGPGRPREYCYSCRPLAGVPAVPLPSLLNLSPVDRAGIPLALHPDDPLAHEVEALRDQAAALDSSAEQHAVIAKAEHAEAAKLRARADRLADPSRGVDVPKPKSALESARETGLLAAAGLAVEDLAHGFGVADLAGALDITAAKATILLAALVELGKVRQHGDGWANNDPDETRVRDFIVSAVEFTADDMAMILEMPPLDVAYYLERAKTRGLVSNGGRVYTYVAPPDDSPRERPRRRPPELDPPAGADAPKRGEPVRIVDHGKAAQPGMAHKMKLRNKAWERAQAAKEVRAEEQRRNAGRSRRRR